MEDTKYQFSNGGLFSGKEFKSFFNWHKQGFACYNLCRDGKHYPVYSPYMAIFLYSEKIKVYTWISDEQKQHTTINGKDYQNSFIDGFIAGEKRFNNEYGVGANALYGEGANALIRELHRLYYHDQNGWVSAREYTPAHITHRNIFEMGEKAGLCYCVEALKKKHEARFQQYNFDKCAKNGKFVEVGKGEENKQPKPNKPVFLIDIWEREKENGELHYNKAIEILKICPKGKLVTEKDGILYWNRSVRGSIQYLAAFIYVMTQKKWIAKWYNAPEYKHILEKTFNTTFNDEPFKSLEQYPPKEQYRKTFENFPVNI